MINKMMFTALFALMANSALAATADFTSLDIDKDGLISKEEALASETVTEQWEILDVNRDGYLKKTELALLDIGDASNGGQTKDTTLKYLDGAAKLDSSK